MESANRGRKEMNPSEASKKLEFHSKQICHGCVHPSMVGWCENHCQLPEAFKMAISALEKQEQVNTQSVNLTHTTYPNALESLKILEFAKDENGCVPMSLVRLAFRNVFEQIRGMKDDKP